MKYLILLVVILVVAWWTVSRRNGPPAESSRESDASPRAKDRQREVVPPQTMLVCAHCGLHLPAAEAVLDADKNPFCTEAHRLAGPRA